MFRFGLAALALCLVGLAAPAAASGEDILRITVDQAQVAKLPANTSTVIIGNPAIADVTTLKNNAGMVVTGKGYGRTNLIALDANGNLLDEMQIHVQPTRNVLVVQRGIPARILFLRPRLHAHAPCSATTPRCSATSAARSPRTTRWLGKRRAEVTPAAPHAPPDSRRTGLARGGRIAAASPFSRVCLTAALAVVVARAGGGHDSLGALVGVRRRAAAGGAGAAARGRRGGGDLEHRPARRRAGRRSARRWRWGCWPFPPISPLQGGALPRINQVTTDFRAPPSYMISSRAREARGAWTPPPPEPEVEAAQRAAYPRIQPMLVDLEPDQAYRMSLRIAKDLGWRIVDANPPNLRGEAEAHIDATDRSLFFGFVADIAIRIRAAGAEDADRHPLRLAHRPPRFRRQRQARRSASSTPCSSPWRRAKGTVAGRPVTDRCLRPRESLERRPRLRRSSARAAKATSSSSICA